MQIASQLTSGACPLEASAERARLESWWCGTTFWQCLDMASLDCPWRCKHGGHQLAAAPEPAPLPARPTSIAQSKSAANPTGRSWPGSGSGLELAASRRRWRKALWPENQAGRSARRTRQDSRHREASRGETLRRRWSRLDAISYPLFRYASVTQARAAGAVGASSQLIGIECYGGLTSLFTRPGVGGAARRGAVPPGAALNR